MSFLTPLFLRLTPWLPRRGPDTHFPIVLTQRRVYILPTRSGIAFAVVLCVMLIGAVNYDLSLGHALVFLLAGLGLVGILHTFRNLAELHCSPGRAEAVFAGETAYFQLLVKNPRTTPKRALTFSFGQHPAASLNLAAHEQASIAVAHPTLRRGRFEPGRLTLASCYPVGLFRAWSILRPPFSCLVYPKPIETPLPLPQASAQHGASPSNLGAEDFAGLREWQTNESPKHIAWKAVAHDVENRPLLIKQFSGAAEELWLDAQNISGQYDLETRLSMLTGWVLAAEQRQVRYGLRLASVQITPNHGLLHRNTCLEALALYDARD